jgi:phosphatidylinositol glycan class S
MAETTTDSVLATESVTSHDGADMVRKQPPPEKPADVRRRTLVIVSFWLIVLCLGLPIWWQTTTIYRAKLPLDDMLDWADGRVGSLPPLPQVSCS